MREKYGRRTPALGTSAFDPVLAEVLYWRCCSRGQAVFDPLAVLDPFAGGPTRGVVAACLGLRYTGVDLSKRQVQANRQHFKKLRRSHPAQMPSAPEWITGDSRDLDRLLPKDYRADFVLTCPPYWNLERYSKDDRDLSNAKTYEEFLDMYRPALTQAVRRLRPGGLAAVVTGDLTDRRTGGLISMVSDTVKIAEAAGAMCVSSGVLMTMLGTAPVRARRQYERTGRTTRVHQYVSIFLKGDPAES
jgi:tRNA G10  N-methylase Trm11